MKTTIIFLLLMGLSPSGQTEIAGLVYLQGSAIGNQTSILSAHFSGMGVIEESLIGSIEQRGERFDPVVGELIVVMNSDNDPEVLGRDLFLLHWMFLGAAI